MNDGLPSVVEGAHYDAETETYRASFDSSEIAPSVAVVKLLAQVKDIEPVELAPLYDVIDPEALDRLQSTAVTGNDSGGCRVKFKYHDCTVTVKSYGIVKAEASTSGNGNLSGDLSSV